jgi:SHS2 domain-containing protein
MTAHAIKQGEHSNEVTVELEGATIEDLFVEAARAVADLSGSPTGDPPGAGVHDWVDSTSREALLVAWINELVERTEIDHLLYTDVEIDDLTDKQVRARLGGRPIGKRENTIVEAQLHASKIEITSEGARAVVHLRLQA